VSAHNKYICNYILTQNDSSRNKKNVKPSTNIKKCIWKVTRSYTNSLEVSQILDSRANG